jgi:hypothetical protein
MSKVTTRQQNKEKIDEHQDAVGIATTLKHTKNMFLTTYHRLVVTNRQSCCQTSNSFCSGKLSH